MKWGSPAGGVCEAGAGADTPKMWLNETGSVFHGHLRRHGCGVTPNLIHVAGKYLIVRAEGDSVLEGKKIEKGQFFTLFGAPDVQAIAGRAQHSVPGRTY